MTHILSLITHPKTPILNESALKRIAELIDLSTARILAPDIAVDIAVTKNNVALETIRGAMRELPVDVNFVPIEGRRKKLLIADMDSTIIEQECIDELAAHIGKYDEIADITERAMRGELNFETALIERVSMLQGLSESAIENTWKARISFTSGADVLIRTMKEKGIFTALVSGGFRQFTSKVAQNLGFEYQSANRLIIENETLTGEIARPILGRSAKADTLDALCKTQNITPDQCLAVGDGANDLDMISLAGMGVAFHAKPATAKAADYQIDHGDLTALLYLQGISLDEQIVELT